MEMVLAPVSRHVLEVMASSGHLVFTWDPADEDEAVRVRAIVAGLQKQGYRFYAVSPDPSAEALAAADGRLLFEPVAAPPGLPSVTTAKPEAGPAETTPPAPLTEETPVAPAESLAERRTRTGKAGAAARKAIHAASRTVAVRPMQGGAA